VASGVRLMEGVGMGRKSAPEFPWSGVLGARWSPAAFEEEGLFVACCDSLLWRHVLALVQARLFL
jgi:hypothetical protein